MRAPVRTPPPHAALLLAALALACAPAPRPSTASPLAASAPGSSSVEAPAPGLPSAPEPRVLGPAVADPPRGASFVSLPVPGRLDAVVSVPAPAGAPRPLLVATHGAGGTPEAHCGFWRAILGDRAFVLCPRGVTLGRPERPEDAGYFYDGHFELTREVDAAIDALVARYGGSVDVKAAAYAGFSQGATMGALMLPLLPRRFSRVVLIEGGSAEWNLRAARLFREGGGERVLFVCGRPGCAVEARLSSTYLQREGVDSRAIHAEGAGHTYGGAVEAEVRGALAWLLEADPRWR